MLLWSICQDRLPATAFPKLKHALAMEFVGPDPKRSIERRIRRFRSCVLSAQLRSGVGQTQILICTDCIVGTLLGVAPGSRCCALLSENLAIGVLGQPQDREPAAL